MKDIETADTILSGAFDPASNEDELPDWDALLPKTYLHDTAATLIVEQGATIKPSAPSSSFTNTHSIRLGDEQLALPRHTISPLSPNIDFEILSTLGRGGMGVVHLARQQALRRDVAIKQINPEQLTDFAVSNLLREAYITGRLEHPNIVPVYLLGVDEEDRPLFVMKRIEGVSWHDALHDERHLPRAYRQHDSVQESHFEIFEQVCLAMHYAHSKGIIHRDLKPENVMLGEFGEVYVVDWGIAVSLREDEEGGVLPLARDANQVVGTPMYMAPEQAAAESRLLGVHTDVYGLGAILHQILTGSTRHQGKSLNAVLLQAYQSSPFEYGGDVPPELGQICNMACARDPQRRHASAEVLREALASYRTQRQAGELLRASREKLEVLRAITQEVLHADQKEVDPERIVEAHSVVGACRFALERAQHIKPQDARIQAQHDDLMNTLLLLEVASKNLTAARAIERTLGESISSEAKKKLEELTITLQEEQARLATLEGLERDVDFNVSRKRKAIFALLLGMVWSLSAILARSVLGQATLSGDAVYMRAFLYKAVVNGVALLLWLLARHFIVMTLINRRILGIVPVIVCFGVMTPVMAWLNGFTLQQSTIIELMLYGAIGGVMGSFVDRWFFGVMVLYVSGAFLASYADFPASSAMTACNLVTFSLVAWRWYQGGGSWSPELDSKNK